MVEYVAVYVCLYVEHRTTTPSSTVGVRGWVNHPRWVVLVISISPHDVSGGDLNRD